jgi:hypothetical protein
LGPSASRSAIPSLAAAQINPATMFPAANARVQAGRVRRKLGQLTLLSSVGDVAYHNLIQSWFWLRRALKISIKDEEKLFAVQHALLILGERRRLWRMVKPICTC